MGKRILAWVVLIGFLLLILNIVFIHIEQGKSFIAYAVIIVFYLYVINKGKKN
jgi:hypothetical protein